MSIGVIVKNKDLLKLENYTHTQLHISKTDKNNFSV